MITRMPYNDNDNGIHHSISNQTNNYRSNTNYLHRTDSEAAVLTGTEGKAIHYVKNIESGPNRKPQIDNCTSACAGRGTVGVCLTEGLMSRAALWAKSGQFWKIYTGSGNRSQIGAPTFTSGRKEYVSEMVVLELGFRPVCAFLKREAANGVHSGTMDVEPVAALMCNLANFTILCSRAFFSRTQCCDWCEELDS